MPRVLHGQRFDPDDVARGISIVIENGCIAEVTERATADGPVLSAGFVDLQINGVDDVDVRRADGPDWDRLAGLIAAQGTTAWCPTIVTAPLAVNDRALERIRHARDARKAGQPRILGAHLEGPFLGGAPGAHDARLLLPIDLPWLLGHREILSIVTLAPELDGAAQAIKAMVQAGIVVSIGHSTATPGHVNDAVDHGATMATHLFNGMSPLHHRAPGIAGAVLADDRIAAGIIADTIHVAPELLKVAARTKGADKLVLVTDAIAWRDPALADFNVSLVDGAPRLANGTLAGSALSMNVAVANAVAAGIGPFAALAAATRNPARTVAFSGGTIEAGDRADIVILDDDFAVIETLIDGRTAFEG